MTTETESKKSATVWVGCKLPNGLVLELGKPEQQDKYQKIILNGSSTAAIQNTAGGFGLTEVPRPFWEEWERKHKHLGWFKHGHVFAVSDFASAQAAGLEREKVLTGLEPLDPDQAPPEVEVDQKHMQKLQRGRGDMRASGIRVA